MVKVIQDTRTLNIEKAFAFSNNKLGTSKPVIIFCSATFN